MIKNILTPCLFPDDITIEMLVPMPLASIPQAFDVSLDEFPAFCGAGSGFGEKVVPDSLLGIRMAPACFFHDICFSIGESWADFHYANGAFRHNLLALIDHQAGPLRRWICRHVAMEYFTAVETAGALVFRDILAYREKYGVGPGNEEYYADVFGHVFQPVDARFHLGRIIRMLRRNEDHD